MKKVKRSLVHLRGTRAMLPHGGLPESISHFMLKRIKKTGGRFGPLGRQFYAQPEKEKRFYHKISADPLDEDEHEVAPGLVYKYEGVLDEKGNVTTYGRVLWTITRFCVTYCRFCTRGREVGLPSYVKSTFKGAIAQKPYLSDDEIQQVFSYLKEHNEINEVIISGGDPLTCPKQYLTQIVHDLASLQKQGYLDVIRLGSRLPVTNPISIQPWHYQLLAEIKNPYLMVHINHPLELSKETVRVLTKFRKQSLATIMSQSVLLKGVNDSPEILYTLFNVLTKEGIRPYYIYQNDPVYWAQHFTVPMRRAIKIWEELRPRLSGISATARFVIDAPHGFGKIPLPEGGAWKVDYSHFTDFKKLKHKTY